jgi:hypothetical protein
MAIIFGWIIIVPPFLAMYNTAKHVQAVEQRLAIQPQLEPALVIEIMLFVSIGNGVYIQEHLIRIWDRAGGAVTPSLPVDPSAPPAMPGPRSASYWERSRDLHVALLQQRSEDHRVARGGCVRVVVEVDEDVLRRQRRDPVGPGPQLGAPVSRPRPRALMEAEVRPSTGHDWIDPQARAIGEHER